MSQILCFAKLKKPVIIIILRKETTSPPPHPTVGPASERGYACSYRHGCYAWQTQWSGKVKCDSSTYPFPYPLPPRFDPLLHVLVVHLPDGLPRVHSAHEDFQRHFFQLCILNKNKIKIARRYCVFDSY